ncbi:MAG TPA: branched-chain amino acid ABC transporter permease/ATP-binding protein, partial [Acidimicrobiales bacterium]|nr:branched-chain amino acid ABC transporter permease/ATP-binding protein [Acidimicrobiales bacterium]
MWVAGNILIGGVITGAVYALLAVGYSLVFSVSGALNLAQGAFVAFGALVMYTFMHSGHLDTPLAFLASLVVVCLAVGVIEWVVIRKAVTQISHANLLMMMGGLLTAAEGLALIVYGSNPFSFNQFSGSKPISLGKLSIPTQGFWVIGAMLASVLVLAWGLSRTRWGRGMRATAENMSAARLMGVPVDRMILLSFVAAAVLGVIAGAVIAPLVPLDYTSMATYTNEGLIAVSLGGLGSVFGSVAGGLVLGVIEAVVGGYVSSLFSTTISLLILIGIIFLRPQGLLGRVRGARLDVADRVAGRIYAPPKLPRNWTRTGAAAVAAAMIFLPYLIPSGDMRAINITGIFCLTIVGLDLLTGVAGQVSLGQAGFMAVGGYTTAILTTNYHFPPLATVPLGVVGAAVVATVLGLVCGRLRGMYLAIITLAFGILVESVASGLNITGGPSGIGGIPPFSVAGFAFDTDNRFFYLIWSLVAVALILSANFVRSNRGRILWAMHGDQIGSRALGLNITRAKVAIFVISACMASVAGSLYADYFRYLSPDQVGSAESLQLITMVVIGGMGTLFGPLLGVTLLTYLPLESQSFSSYSILVTGVLLVGFLRYLPAGMFGGLLELVQMGRLRWARRAVPAGAAAGGAATSGAEGGGLAPPPGTGTVPSAAVADPPVPPSGTGPPVASRRGAVSSSPVDGAAERPGLAARPPVGAGAGAGAGAPVTAGDVPITGAPGLAAGRARKTDHSTPALEVTGLTKHFGGVAAVNDVNFTVAEGSLTALIGPNGAGKSTLFNLVTNLYRPDAGRVLLHGQPITGMRPDRVISLGLFRTFQTARVFQQMTVLDNVLVGAYRLGRAGYLAESLRSRRCRREESAFEARAWRLLEVLRLADRAHERAAVLPLAAQKYLELARALMARPSVVLFDEPGAGMNEAETAELGMILKAVRDVGHTVVVVEHNMNLVMG